MTRAKLAPSKLKKISKVTAKVANKAIAKKTVSKPGPKMNGKLADKGQSAKKSESKAAGGKPSTAKKSILNANPSKNLLLELARKQALNTMDEPTTKLGAKWQTLINKAKNVTPVPYKMSETYEVKTAIEHKVLGLGFVMDNRNDRLEVLFRDGIRVLISNYKSVK